MVEDIGNLHFRRSHEVMECFSKGVGPSGKGGRDFDELWVAKLGDQVGGYDVGAW